MLLFRVAYMLEAPQQMMQLRHYQEEAVVGLFEYFTKKAGNPIVALPTGTGKALVIAEFCRRALYCYPGTRILIATHVKELVEQNHNELLEQWPTAPAGIYSAGLKRKELHLPITFCGIASVKNAVQYFGCVHLLIVDECHLISDKSTTMYRKVIEELKKVNPFLKVIGLTASPFRLGSGLLTEGNLFTDISTDYCSLEKFNQLLDEGFLSPLVPKRTSTELDVHSVAIHGGEFVAQELAAAVDRDSITRAACEEAVEQAIGRNHWLVFCVSTDHADHTAAILRSLGVSCVVVHSKLPGGDAERTQSINLFRSGQVRAMVGVNVFTTGFNYKPIDCILVLRPTMSTGLWVQLLGRGTRPSPETGKQNCLVLDFAANTRRLGPINDPVIPRKRGKKTGLVPFKICEHCQTYNHTRVRFCTNCGAEFPVSFAATGQAATDELIRKTEDKPKPPPKPPKPEGLVATHEVTRVEYAKHWSRDQTKPPSLRVTYWCDGGTKVFNEWLCFEHTGFARRKAREAWRQMADAGVIDDPDATPETVDAALAIVEDLQPPSHIRVLVGDKYSEVVGYDFARPMHHSTIETGLFVANPEDDVPF